MFIGKPPPRVGAPLQGYVSAAGFVSAQPAQRVAAAPRPLVPAVAANGASARVGSPTPPVVMSRSRTSQNQVSRPGMQRANSESSIAQPGGDSRAGAWDMHLNAISHAQAPQQQQPLLSSRREPSLRRLTLADPADRHRSSGVHSASAHCPAGLATPGRSVGASSAAAPRQLLRRSGSGDLPTPSVCPARATKPVYAVAPLGPAVAAGGVAFLDARVSPPPSPVARHRRCSQGQAAVLPSSREDFLRNLNLNVHDAQDARVKPTSGHSVASSTSAGSAENSLESSDSGSAKVGPGVAAPVLKTPAGVGHVTELLLNRDMLKVEVVRCFKQVAPGAASSINISGLQRFRELLSMAISVPEESFGDIDVEYIRFDFDGNGSLHFNEVYKLVKHHLWMYLKKLGGVSQVDIPLKTRAETQYTLIQKLGHGNQGVVMLAKDHNGQECCIKCYDKKKMLLGGVAELKDEFETMQRLSCEKIAHAFEIFQDTQYYYMVNEAYHGGDLTTMKQRAKDAGVAMTEPWWQDVFRQCFKALAFMHEQAMMHCDIKEPNIMLKTTNFGKPDVVLIDFGVSRAMAAEDSGTIGGTPGYMPPEVLELKGGWYPGGDVFSMGVVIMQIMTDKIPVTNGPNSRGLFLEGCATLQDVFHATRTRQPPFHLMPAEMPDLKMICQRLLEKKMNWRPRAPQVLLDPWFGGRFSLAARLPQVEHPLGTMGITEEFFHAYPPPAMPPPMVAQPIEVGGM